MRFRLLLIGILLAGPSVMWASRGAIAGSKETCQRGCNKRCSGASNKAKCVAQCRRACR